MPVGGGCKILQPRGTHRDVISTTELETYYNPAVLQLPSHSVSRAWMAHSPWPVSRKVSIYPDYRSTSTPSSFFFAHPQCWLTGWCFSLSERASARSFTLLFQLPAAYLGRRLRRTKISFFTRRQGPRRRVQERRRRRHASCVADFFHYSS